MAEHLTEFLGEMGIKVSAIYTSDVPTIERTEILRDLSVPVSLMS